MNISQLNHELDTEIIPETHPPMYLMHKYWARKPANIVAQYIQKYSKTDEIVFDPFMGSGVTLIESLIQGRKAIGADINPLAHFITQNTAIYIPIEELKRAFSHLKQQIYLKDGLYSKLYIIDCPKCQNQAEITHTIWDQKENSDNHEITEIRIHCPNCRELCFSSKENKEFFSKLSKIIYEKENSALVLLASLQLQPPKFNFSYHDSRKFLQLRHDLRKNNTIQNLFTNRNFAFLTYLRHLINLLPNSTEETKNLCNFCFTSALGQASKMVWVIDKRKGERVAKRQVGSWTHHFFWDPTTFFEVNAWNCYIERFEKLLKGKQNSNLRFDQSQALKFKSAPDFSHLTPSNPILLFNQSAEKLDLPSDSVDFIFTDPPYGDSIQYGELSTFWAAWIGLNMDSYLAQMEQKEITMNTRQDKTLKRYQQDLTTIFHEAYRVLKPNKFMIVTFHNTDFSIRNAIITAIIESGFDLCQILHQMPPRVSIKSMLHYEGSPVGDYYIRFQKANRTQTHQKEILTPAQIEENIANRIKEILISRGEPTSFLWISNFLDEFLCQKNLFPLSNFDIIMTNIRHSGQYLIDQKGYWWFNSPQLQQLEPPLSKRIQTRIEELVTQMNSKKVGKKTVKTREIPLKQYIFNELYQDFRGIYTPDKFFVNKILDDTQNFQQLENDPDVNNPEEE